MNKLIIISGPTASGKTSTSIKLAQYIKENLKQKVAIVNFDSLLFYKEISIGTAKPSIIEQKDIEHYLINIVSINSPLNASDFIEMALLKIEELHRNNTIAILVGGSAFYLRALLKGMYQGAKSSDSLKVELNNIYQDKGISYFIDFLKEFDPESLQILHENDHYRLIRAVEFYKLTNSKISDQKKELDSLSPYDFSKHNRPWDIIHFYLDLPKEDHQKIIEDRTKKMIDDGLVAEVKNLLELGLQPELKPLQSIGYFETLAYLKGHYSSIQSYIERIVISTRQLAKSQRTFFKKIEPKIEIHPLKDQEKILNITSQFLANKRDT